MVSDYFIEGVNVPEKEKKWKKKSYMRYLAQSIFQSYDLQYLVLLCATRRRRRRRT